MNSTTMAAKPKPEEFYGHRSPQTRRVKNAKGGIETIVTFFLSITTRANLADEPGPGLIKKAAFLVEPVPGLLTRR